MALNSNELEDMIIANLAAAGFATSNEYSQIQVLANAIANAVVDHIQSSAVAVTPAGNGTVE